jgi:hypothetical protein
VNHLRTELLKTGLKTLDPQEQIRKKLKQRGPQPLQQLLQRQQQENLLLDVQERQLAQQLFQQSSLNVFLRKLSEDSLDVLRGKLQANSPLIRLLVIQAIGRRHLHLEMELIACLHDPIPEVRQGARQALIRVARGTDFGPLPGWSRVGITRSVERWQHWLALQQADSLDPLAPSKPVGKPAPAELALATLASPGLMIEKVLAPSTSTLAAVDPRAGKLSAELVAATGDKQAELLTRLRDAKGIEHTDALARAIPQMAGEVRDKARDALVQRLTRMTARTLRGKFDEDDVEVRRAAARACARKEASEHIPDLLELLNDPEALVVQAARQSLKELTGQDFGPELEADPNTHARAVAAWYGWWQKRPADKK